MTHIVTRSRRAARPLASLAALASAATLAVLLRPAAVAAQQPASSPARAPYALSLDDAVRLAERQSEALRVAEAGVQRAAGQQLQARSQYFPQLNAAAGYQRTLRSQFQEIGKRSSGGGTRGDSTTNDLANSPIARIFASKNTMTLSVTGSQTLYSGGRVAAVNRAAAAGRRAAAIGVAAARAQLTLDVAQAYYDAVLSERLAAVAESSLVQTERTFRQATASRSVGSSSQFELLRARVTRDNQRPLVIQARTQRRIAYLRLRQLLDLPLDQPLRLTTDLPLVAPGVAPSRLASAAPSVDESGIIPAQVQRVTVDPAEALAEDPRVAASVDSVVATADTAAAERSSTRQARESIEAQRNQLRAARAQRLPALQLSSNYQRFAYPPNVVPSALNQFFPNWTVSLGVSVPLFTGGRIRGEELVATANLREAEQQARQVEELAALDAQVAVSQLAQAEAAWLASAGTAEEAATAYQIAEVRYREGISTQVELSDSRLLAQQAQWNSATAARDLLIARLRLRLLRDLPLAAGGAAGQQGAGGSWMGGPGAGGVGGAGGAGGAGGGGGPSQTPRQNQAPQQAGGAPTAPFGGGDQ